MIVSLSRVGAPAALPLTLAEAKAHLRVDGTADDALIGAYLEAAVETVEGFTGRALMPQDWEMRLGAFPASAEAIETHHAPLIEVLTIKTVSALGAETTLDASTYQVVAPAGPYAGRGKILVGAGRLWPTTDDDVLGPVRITYRAGYAAVPAALSAAILLLLGDSYANREAASVAKVQDQPALDRLLSPFKMFWS